MKNYFLILFILVAGTTISCQTHGETSSVNSISHIDFTNGKNILLDVRTPEEFAEGHIPNAINLDVNSENFDSKIKELDPDKTYYVYCRSGKRSTKAVNKLHQEGFHDLVHLKDGYSNYKE
ncbi:MAG: rhodanese-like domain-containing protein [Weeksellaceae bacterium]|jgi:rhodanese-related sulfurtransferase|nr:rhodanese-like domain-containing protein [Weeksellaceae bacterium]